MVQRKKVWVFENIPYSPLKNVQFLQAHFFTPINSTFFRKMKNWKNVKTQLIPLKMMIKQHLKMFQKVNGFSFIY